MGQNLGRCAPRTQALELPGDFPAVTILGLKTLPDDTIHTHLSSFAIEGNDKQWALHQPFPRVHELHLDSHLHRTEYLIEFLPSWR